MTLQGSIAAALGRFGFARKTAAAPSAPAAAGDLYTEQAIGQVLNALWGIADPDEVLRKAGLTRAALRMLEGDDEIATALETRLAGVLVAPWRLDPYDATIAPFIEAELTPLMEHALTGAWSAVPYGYSVLEAVYVQRSDGRIGLAELEEKPFEWFTPTQDKRLIYRSPQAPQAVDTAFKFFLTRRRATYRNPYGEALLSRAYWPWFLRSAGWRAWARFLERSAGPLLLGKTVGDASAMATALAEAALSGAVAVGSTDEVEAIAPPNVGAAFDLFQSAVDRRIQKLVLGQTLTTDVSKTGGSYAAAKVHEGVRADRTAADLRMLRTTMQAVVNALCALNFPAATPPTIILGQEKGLGTERADRDKALVDAGIVQLTEKYLLDRYDFDRGDFVVPTAAPARPPGPAKASAQFAAGRFTPAQEAVEALTDEAIADAPGLIDPRAIREAVRTSANADELMDNLAALFADQPPEAFREWMARALFAADVMGFANAGEE